MRDSISHDGPENNLEEAILRSRKSKQAALCEKCHRELRIYGETLCATCIHKKRAYPRVARKRWEQYLKATYHLSAEEYESMLFRQGGVCAVCGETEKAINPATGEVRKLAVDHNHATGDIRELLCHTCNTLLGFMEKDRERVKKLEKYLKKHDS